MTSIPTTQEYSNSLLSIFPVEIFYLIIQQINDHKTFKSISQTCKLFNQICQEPKIQNNSKEKMRFKIIIPESSYSCFKKEYFILPNQWRHGEYKSWYNNGQLLQHYFCKDGKREGAYKNWYSINGQLREYYFYKDGKKEGECKSWHYNAQLRIHCFYKDDKLEGEYKEWDKYGRILKYCSYKDNYEKIKL